MATARIASALVLTAWTLPGAGALAVGLHLTLEEHGPHGARHALEILDLAQAAAHGHHHDAEAAADHDHDARVDGPGPIVRPGHSGSAVLPAPTSLESVPPARSVQDGSPRRGPPVPLFTAHCSLLL